MEDQYAESLVFITYLASTLSTSVAHGLEYLIF